MEKIGQAPFRGAACEQAGWWRVLREQGEEVVCWIWAFQTLLLRMILYDFVIHCRLSVVHLFHFACDWWTLLRTSDHPGLKCVASCSCTQRTWVAKHVVPHGCDAGGDIRGTFFFLGFLQWGGGAHPSALSVISVAQIYLHVCAN